MGLLTTPFGQALRALALTCDDFRSLWSRSNLHASQLKQVFHRLATQSKSLRKFNLPLLASPFDQRFKYTIIYKYGKRTRQLEFKRELKNFPSRDNGGRRKSLLTGVERTQVTELLENATPGSTNNFSNILGAFSIKQLFHSRLFDMR